MNNKWMILMGIVAAGLLALFFFMKERHFVWNADTKFLADDDEPFGSELFDEMAKETLPKGYQVFEGDFDELLDTDKRCALLVLSTDLTYNYDFYVDLVKFVKKGNKVMLVSTGIYNQDDEETFECFNTNISGAYFSKDLLEDELTGRRKSSKVVVNGVDTLVIPDVLLGKIQVSPHNAHATSYSYYDTNNSEPLTDDVISVLSYEAKEGYGKAYVVAAPLLFTNYGVLDKNISHYLSYQMGQLADLPVVRVSTKSLNQYYYNHDGYYDNGRTRDSSPLSHLLQYEPLRWALYTLLCAALIFMFFTARHRQRVIPVVAKPVNRNMEFVKLLGTIYYRRHDNLDLFLKKYTYFKEELRRSQMVDLDDERMREGNARMLAQRTKMEEEDVAKTLQLLRTVADAEALGNKQLQECINKIDDILARL